MKKGKKDLIFGSMMLVLFIIWTGMIQCVDVKMIGVNDTAIGFATLNCWFHEFTGVHWELYHITDWLGLVPIAVCMIFGTIGLKQLVKRRGLWKVDFDLILLGVYYVLVIVFYLVFEMIPINYRPVLIEGYMEVSYPSSTTLLVLSVMPTVVFQTSLRVKNISLKKLINVLTMIFSIFMVVGRTVSGVHWITDIVGSILFSSGLFHIYTAVVLLTFQRRNTEAFVHGIS